MRDHVTNKQTKAEAKTKDSLPDVALLCCGFQVFVLLTPRNALALFACKKKKKKIPSMLQTFYSRSHHGFDRLLANMGCILRRCVRTKGLVALEPVTSGEQVCCGRTLKTTLVESWSAENRPMQMLRAPSVSIALRLRKHVEFITTNSFDFIALGGPNAQSCTLLTPTPAKPLDGTTTLQFARHCQSTV